MATMTIPLANHVDGFREAMLAAGLTPPDQIEPGGFHRFPGIGKKNGNKAGWCKMFPDGMGGTFGDYSTDLYSAWQAKRDRPMTTEEAEIFKQEVAEARRQAERERQARQAVAAKKAAAIWEQAKPAGEDHPYLLNKGCLPHGLRQTDNGKLVVPMRDTGGKLHSLQHIDKDGGKLFLLEGRVSGCYFSIGKLTPGGPVCIAEGFATAASIYQATGYPVAVAFNTGNLKAVAQVIRTKLPETRLILCADDDAATDGNPGITKATEASLVVGGWLAVPNFGPERPEGVTDFNDLHINYGKEKVAACIEAAQMVTKDVGQATPAQINTVPDIEQKGEPANDEDIIQRLVALSPLQYDRERRDMAKSLGVRPSTLDRMVQAARKEEETDTGLVFDDLEPWPEPVDGAMLLAEVAVTVRRFIVCQPETAHAVALWASMTWLMDVVQVAPLAVITAPEKRCGKSQLLSVLGGLVARPLTASGISSAALYRTVEKWRPTLLIDEADAFMKENEEMRGLLNSGHTRDGAYIIRVVGDNHEPKRFNTWGAKALAGIGKMADTLMDRAVVLELRRKLPHEQVERLRYAEPELFETLAEKLCRFAEDHREAVRKARPDLPAKLNDRAQDNWEPLLAIADIAGGQWPALARTAALKLSGASESSLTIGVELLADIQEVFAAKSVDRISTADLIAALCEDEEKPWSTYNRGVQIKPRQVSSRLAEYGVRSNTIRVGINTPKGFMREHFEEAFSRYLAFPPSASATPPQPAPVKVSGVADETQRCGNEALSATRNPAPDKGCGGVADRMGGMGEKEKITVTI